MLCNIHTHTHTCGIRVFILCIVTLAQQVHLTGTASLAPACQHSAKYNPGTCLLIGQTLRNQRLMSPVFVFLRKSPLFFHLVTLLRVRLLYRQSLECFVPSGGDQGGCTRLPLPRGKNSLKRTEKTLSRTDLQYNIFPLSHH